MSTDRVLQAGIGDAAGPGMTTARRAPDQRPEFRTSSACSDGTCVGVARDGDDVLVADTKPGPSAPLRFTRAEWAAFVAGVKNGEFDLD